MRETGTYTRVQIASVVAGIGIMSAIGGATLAHTHDMTATTLALLASAVGLTLLGRRTLRWWWGEVMLGLKNPYGEPHGAHRDPVAAQSRYRRQRGGNAPGK